jgi:hypothetical protein
MERKTLKTLIQVSKATVEKLKRLGAKGESYDAIILRLIEVFEGRR